MNRTYIRLLALALAATPLISSAEDFEAVTGRASPDYVREKQANGSPKPEAYAFGKGGYWSGEIDDKTIDHMDFMDVAKIISKPLSDQGYVPGRDPKSTKLLIMLYWGTTYAPEHASDSLTYQQMSQAIHDDAVAFQQHVQPQVQQQLDDNESAAITEAMHENHKRDVTDRRNAKMLGYDSWWDATFTARAGTPQELRRRDMMAELEEDRYFVVLMAYDFQLLAKEKKHKLLWETRFSIRQHVNAFDQALPAMALEASRYFGRDSGGLVHDTLPDGKVDLGEIRDLGTVEGK